MGQAGSNRQNKIARTGLLGQGDARTGLSGKGCQHMTARIQPIQDRKERTARKKTSRNEQLEQDSQNETSRMGQPERDSQKGKAGIGKAEQDRQNRLPAQDCQNRTVITKLLGPDRTEQDSRDRTAGTGHPGRDSQDKTARKGLPALSGWECWDRTVKAYSWTGTYSHERTARRGQPEKNSQKRTTRTRRQREEKARIRAFFLSRSRFAIFLELFFFALPGSSFGCVLASVKGGTIARAISDFRQFTFPDIRYSASNIVIIGNSIYICDILAVILSHLDKLLLLQLQLLPAVLTPAANLLYAAYLCC